MPGSAAPCTTWNGQTRSMMRGTTHAVPPPGRCSTTLTWNRPSSSRRPADAIAAVRPSKRHLDTRRDRRPGPRPRVADRRHRAKSIRGASSSRSGQNPIPSRSTRNVRSPIARNSRAMRRSLSRNPTPGFDAAHCAGCRAMFFVADTPTSSACVIASSSACHSNQTSPPRSSSTLRPGWRVLPGDVGERPRPHPRQGHAPLVHVPIHRARRCTKAAGSAPRTASATAHRRRFPGG